MPIYEYRRKTDGKIIEVRQSIKDDPLTVCPETGEPVEKIVSRSSFHLKGQGWYTTDYKSPAKPSDAETPKPTATESPKAEPAPAKTEKTSNES